MKLLYCLLFVIFLNTSQSLKILGVFPTAAKSHYILTRALMRGLAEKGHDVTVINPIGEKTPPKNGTYRDILIKNVMTGSDSDPDMNLFDLEDMNFLVFSVFMNFMGNQLTEATLSDPNVQKLLKSDEKFDVVILEQFVDDGLRVLAHHYKVPLVLFSTFASNAWVNPLVGNPAPPSYIPEQNIHFDFLNFFDRLKNFIIYVAGELNRHLFFFPSQNRIIKQFFPDAPPLQDLLYNSSLVLLNSHWSTNKAVPRVPSMIDIGGFHVNPPKKLPEDLQEYLDSAKDGVIYFSMGSTLQSANFPVEKREAFLKVFSKLKQKILWKWEDEVLPGQPSNVKLGKWLPQQDILAHANVKAFITHGGLLSSIESVYHGVPVLAIPVFGDQKWNAAQAARNNYGRYVMYNELNEETLTKALNEVLNNPKYRENMKRRSKIMRDRQQTPLDDADYWIQYVVRHQGATHLKIDGLKLSWYQYLSLDVVAFICVVGILNLYFLSVLMRFIFSLCCKSKTKKIKKS